MSVQGTWTLEIDWTCSGNYTRGTITFNTDGTFTYEGLGGIWSSHDGQILFQFTSSSDNTRTTYGGTVAASSMVGISSTFSGLNGCWFATKTTATTKTFAEQKPKYDPSGAVTK